jgi:hypothetical protein
MSCFLSQCFDDTDAEDYDDDFGGNKISCGRRGISLRFLVLFLIFK